MPTSLLSVSPCVTGDCMATTGEERARVKHPPAGRVWMPTELLAVWTAIAANGTTMTTYTVRTVSIFCMTAANTCRDTRLSEHAGLEE